MTDEQEKITRRITLIRNGTVIDHLNPRVVFQVVRILGIDDDIEETVTVGTNLKSSVLGKKGIIKISNHFISKEEVNKLSVISPNATVSIIEEYEVREKYKVRFPKEVKGILNCPNPNCITTVEEIETRFKLIQESPILLFCVYCERYIKEHEIEIL